MYYNYSDEERLKVGKRTAEMGVTSTIRHYKEEYKGRPLKESTIRTWMNSYKKGLAVSKVIGKDVSRLAIKPRGHPLLLGTVLDNQLREHVKNLRDVGAIVNSAIVISAAEGLIKSHDSNLLECNGGHIILTKSWAKSFLLRLGFVKRRVSTKAKVNRSRF